jgi:hypothetical protein
LQTYKDLFSHSKINIDTYWDSVSSLYEFNKKQKEIDSESLTSISDSEESTADDGVDDTDDEIVDGDVRDEINAGNNNIYAPIWSTTSSQSETNSSDYASSAYHNNYTSVGYNTKDTASSYNTTSNYNYFYENYNANDDYAFLNYPHDEENQTYFHL